MDDQLEELRRHLLGQLAMLQEAYRRDAKPILDRLVEIESLRPPEPIILTALEWEKSGKL